MLLDMFNVLNKVNLQSSSARDRDHKLLLLLFRINQTTDKEVQVSFKHG